MQSTGLRVRFHESRLRLSEFHASTEHALWSLSRLDQRIDATRVALVTQRGRVHDRAERERSARPGAVEQTREGVHGGSLDAYV